MNNVNILYKELSHTIIGIAMRVHTSLGGGLPEIVYTRSVAIELEATGIPYSREFKVLVEYNGEPVGHLIPDLVIDDKIIIEAKSDKDIYPHHLSQLLSYLRATRIRVGYVVNFGVSSLQFKRLIL